MVVPGALLAILVAACAAPADLPAPAAPVVIVADPVPASPARTDQPPVSVRIDAIGVSSTLQPMGLAPDGTAEVPTDFDRVGWFSASAPGSTVLLGHVDSRVGPAVFYRLRDLRAGDEIELGTTGGGASRFRVERTEQVAKDDFPTSAVFGASTDDVLRLVTCAGEFDRGERSYTDNLVVHATRI